MADKKIVDIGYKLYQMAVSKGMDPKRARTLMETLPPEKQAELLASFAKKAKVAGAAGAASLVGLSEDQAQADILSDNERAPKEVLREGPPSQSEKLAEHLARIYSSTPEPYKTGAKVIGKGIESVMPAFDALEDKVDGPARKALIKALGMTTDEDITPQQKLIHQTMGVRPPKSDEEFIKNDDILGLTDISNLALEGPKASKNAWRLLKGIK